MRHLNFGHLETLYVLFEERHISRTAHRLSITQSAVSKTLAAMRVHFDDPLLVRGAGGYHLSHKGTAIEAKLQTLLPQLRQLGRNAEQDIGTLDQEFRICTADDVILAFLPPILNKFREVAPNVKFTVTHDVSKSLDDLQANKIDLVIDTPPGTARPFVTKPIAVWSWKCIMRKSHPLAGRLTLEDYVSAKHGLVSFSGQKFGLMDQALGALNRVRSITLIVPSFLAIRPILDHTDAIFTVPEPIERDMINLGNCASHSLPFTVPELPISLVWHPRNQNDSIHEQLRRLVAEAIAKGSASI